MVDSRQKGARAETNAKDILVKYTGHNWKRVPGSGALSADHMLKGDLYIPEVKNKYCVEVKHYKDDQFTTKIFTSKEPALFGWWKQANRQATQVKKIPLLIFKHDRSKFFVCTHDYFDSINYRTAYIPNIDASICKLEDWLTYDKPKFII